MKKYSWSALEGYNNLIEFGNALFELRKIYDECRSIATSETANSNVKLEMQRLTEGDFYDFIGRSLRMTNQE